MRNKRVNREGIGEQRHRIKRFKSQKITLKELSNNNEPKLLK